MVGAETSMTGACLCGAVTLSVAHHEGGVHACHCRMCQRWTGGVYVMVPAAPEDVKIEGPVRRYRSSSFAERAFCGTCGSHLWLRNDGADYELMPGLFDAAASLPLTSEIYVDRALKALSLAGDHPRRTRAEYEAENAFVPKENLP
jgi:hypothetical protein